MQQDQKTSEIKKQCTFQPQINAVSSSLSFENFMKSQEMHNKKADQFLNFCKKLKI